MDILFSVVVFIIGVLLLERGADLFTDRVGELVERTGVSETVIGLLTAGIEWEELLVSLVAVFSGSPAIAVGNVVGACIGNLTGSFSLGLLAKPISITRENRWFALFTLLITVGVSALLARGEIGRGEGALLVGVFAVYFAATLLLLVRGLFQPGFEREEEGGGRHGPLGDLVLAMGGLALILLGAEAVVQASLTLAHALELSEFVIGLTVVAFGTTLPDKVISVAGALKGQSGIVVANALGSNIFNLTAVLGLAALVAPLAVDDATRGFDVPVLVGVTLLTGLLFLRQGVGRLAGAGLLTLYLAYLYINVFVK